MRSVFGLLPVAFVVAVMILLCGCGGSEFTTTGRSVGLTEASSVDFEAADPGIMLRDIADKNYDSAWIGAYSYTNATVSASFVTPANELEITFTGSGLKPNFAYQFKLEGLPGDDPVANQTLRDLGRTWEDLGYLIFGYMVTDANGNIVTATSDVWYEGKDTTVAVNSSYHVLWRAADRALRRFDGPVLTSNVLWQTTYYDVSELVPGPTVGVYAEWETGKPKPGTLRLPDGTYKVLLRITEESFHDPFEWPTVLSVPIEFTIGDGEVPPPPPPSGPGAIRGLVTDASGRLARKASVTLTDQLALAPERQTTALADGTYSFADVPSGAARYTVTASAKRGSTISVENISVAEGQTTTVDLQLP